MAERDNRFNSAHLVSARAERRASPPTIVRSWSSHDPPVASSVRAPSPLPRSAAAQAVGGGGGGANFSRAVDDSALEQHDLFANHYLSPLRPDGHQAAGPRPRHGAGGAEAQQESYQGTEFDATTNIDAMQENMCGRLGRNRDLLRIIVAYHGGAVDPTPVEASGWVRQCARFIKTARNISASISSFFFPLRPQSVAHATKTANDRSDSDRPDSDRSCRLNKMPVMVDRFGADAAAYGRLRAPSGQGRGEEHADAASGPQTRHPPPIVRTHWTTPVPPANSEDIDDGWHISQTMTGYNMPLTDNLPSPGPPPGCRGMMARFSGQFQHALAGASSYFCFCKSAANRRRHRLREPCTPSSDEDMVQVHSSQQGTTSADFDDDGSFNIRMADDRN
jgi:hypothetical protein